MTERKRKNPIKEYTTQDHKNIFDTKWVILNEIYLKKGLSLAE